MPEPSDRSVIVVGAINVDLVVVAPRLPKAGETVVGGGLQTFGGGKGANAAVAAARVGANVRLIGAVGVDDMGSNALAELTAAGVDVSFVAQLDGQATGVALIVVDRHGENQIAVGPGANAALTEEHVRRCLSQALSSAGCVLVSTEIPEVTVAAAVEAATAANVPCILNPAPVVPVVATLLDRGPLLTPNRAELAAVTALLGEPVSTVNDSATRVAQRTRRPVLVTLGGSGVAAVGPNGQALHLPAPPVHSVDTTGAGDTFNGVLAARIAAGKDLDAALPAAVTAASLSVTKPGARGGMPTAAELEAAF
jgi:ribokinase